MPLSGLVNEHCVSTRGSARTTSSRLRRRSRPRHRGSREPRGRGFEASVRVSAHTWKGDHAGNDETPARGGGSACGRGVFPTACGRYQTRTDDLFRVKEARYQLRQSPVPVRGTSNDPTGCGGAARTTTCDTRDARSVLHGGEDRLKSFKCPGCESGERNADVAQLVAHHLAKVRVASSSLVIRSSAGIPFGGSRHVGSNHTRWRGRAARHRPAKPFTRVRIPSPPPLPVPTGARLGRLAQR